MPLAGLEPKIPVSEWLQTQALDRAATGIGPVPLWPSHIPHGLACDRTRAFVARIQWLTATATARVPQSAIKKWTRKITEMELNCHQLLLAVKLPVICTYWHNIPLMLRYYFCRPKIIPPLSACRELLMNQRGQACEIQKVTGANDRCM